MKIFRIMIDNFEYLSRINEILWQIIQELNMIDFNIEHE